MFNRKCPNCRRKNIPILRLAIFGELAKLKCQDCLSEIQVSQWLSLGTYYLVTILCVGALFGFIELFGLIGLPIGFLFWFSLEVVRSILLPLTSKENKKGKEQKGDVFN